MARRIIHIADGVAKNPVWRMAEPVCFSMFENEHIAITGPNGGGKTMLAEMIMGKHPLLRQSPVFDFPSEKSQLISDNIKYIAFRDTYGGDNDRNYFLQQRWNSTEIDPQTPTVKSLIERDYAFSGTDTPKRQRMKEHLLDIFEMRSLLEKFIILLSSGEMRKLQLIRALLSAPSVLILDNPFIGLDSATRHLLKQLLERLSKEQTLQFILILSRDCDIPDFITHVIGVRNMKVGEKMSRVDFFRHKSKNPENQQISIQVPYTLFNQHSEREEENSVIEMNNISIRYGSRIILNNLNWHVRKGERWALLGPNGSGKSTLLSIVCADNPQSYACDVSLFGKKRGTGESIWEIKKRIGYVSPEMHRAYKRNLPAIRIVASGLKDTVGLYCTPTEEEYEKCRKWMELFHVSNLSDKPFLQLSSGEQRMILLVRAFVKNPDLLILDEPYHGLDDANHNLLSMVIDSYCRQPDKTLIMVTHYDEDLPKCISNRLYLHKAK